MSTVRLLVLGVVRMHGHAHGYAVHRELTGWRVDTWTAVKPPSIYHAVKQLAREGKLRPTGSTDAPSGPARVDYEITTEGDDEFFALLEAALLSPDIEEFGAGIAFMQCLPRARVVQLLTAHIQGVDGIDDQLEALKPQWPDPGQPPHAQHLLDLWRGLFASNSAWTREILGQIRAGSFSFVGD